MLLITCCLSVSEVLEECYYGFGDSPGVLCVDICFVFLIFFTFFLSHLNFFVLLGVFFFLFIVLFISLSFVPSCKQNQEGIIEVY